MTVNQRKEENLNRLFKFLLDSQDIPFARKACRHVYPSTKPRKPDPINKMDQKTGVFGFLKAQKEWCENNNMSYVAFCCCCVLPNTAESANMISSAQLAGEARNTVLESHSTCSRQAGGRFKVESRNRSFM